MAHQLLTNCKAATMVKGQSGYGLIEDAAIVFENEKLVWVGSQADLPSTLFVEEKHDLEGRLVTPGLIDCHTHLVFGGDRAREFEMRLEGASYEEVARAGGGIVSTMKATREASEEELLGSALPRLDALLAEGVSTVEIKSGYGLSIDDEISTYEELAIQGHRHHKATRCQ